MTALEEALEDAFRREYGRVVATLIKATRDWDLAEDAAQEALARASEHWPQSGVPSNPGAWLMTVARRFAMDRLRRAAADDRKHRQAALDEAAPVAVSGRDDRLDLIFTCCHPALRADSQVALTLRSLTSLSTADIARAFLVSEATMSRRLIRAKQKIREAAIPFRVPTSDMLDARLDAVLAILYLIYNQGYGDSPQLRAEAIDLARLLDELLPNEPEVMGLRALMLLHEARATSRVATDGTLVPLEEQDRALWDRSLAQAGTDILEQALAFRRVGSYQLQAAIAACHTSANRFDDTDWGQIRDLYELLSRLTPSPVVELNRAVAVGMADSPSAALDLLDSLSEPLSGYYLLPAARGDMLRRLARLPEAKQAYGEALAMAPGAHERRYLQRRLGEVS